MTRCSNGSGPLAKVLDLVRSVARGPVRIRFARSLGIGGPSGIGCRGRATDGCQSARSRHPECGERAVDSLDLCAGPSFRRSQVELGHVTSKLALAESLPPPAPEATMK